MTLDEDKNKIHLAIILEVLGKPPEHLVAVLNDITTKLSEEGFVKLISKKISEPKELEKSPGFFSAFADVEVEVSGLSNVSVILFKYTPSHLEIVSPENIQTTNNNFQEILNEVSRKLHGYDEVARVLQAENQMLKQRLQQATQYIQQNQKPAEKSEKKEKKKSAKKKVKKK